MSIYSHLMTIDRLLVSLLAGESESYENLFSNHFQR